MARSLHIRRSLALFFATVSVVLVAVVSTGVANAATYNAVTTVHHIASTGQTCLITMYFRQDGSYLGSVMECD